MFKLNRTQICADIHRYFAFYLFINPDHLRSSVSQKGISYTIKLFVLLSFLAFGTDSEKVEPMVYNLKTRFTGDFKGHIA